MAVVVEHGAVDPDLRGRVTRLGQEAGTQRLRCNAQHVAVSLRGQREQAFVALAVERALGVVQSGARDRADLVLVAERTEGSLPDLEEVRPAVERDYLGEKRRKQIEAIYEGLLGRYTVVIERPGETGEAVGR